MVLNVGTDCFVVSPVAELPRNDAVPSSVGRGRSPSRDRESPGGFCGGVLAGDELGVGLLEQKGRQ
jgi:hypothetical protein